MRTRTGLTINQNVSDYDGSEMHETLGGPMKHTDTTGGSPSVRLRRRSWHIAVANAAPRTFLFYLRKTEPSAATGNRFLALSS